MHRVFVYGTLKKGQPNHYLIQDISNGVSKYLGEGTTVEKYPLVVASKYNIPFLLDAPGKGKNVIGQVFEVDDRMQDRLNRLERHPVFYTARQIDIKCSWNSEPDNTVMCSSYLLKNFHDHLLSLPCLASYDHAVFEAEDKTFVTPAEREESPESLWKEVKWFPENN